VVASRQDDEEPPVELTPVVTVSPPVAPVPAPPPTAPSLTAVPWLFERRQSPLTAPSGLFGRPGRDDDQPDDVFAGRAGTTGTSGVPDAFAIHRGRAAESATSWRSGPGAPAAITPPPPARERRRPQNEDAARCFDRGLLFVADRKYDLALEQWERARELDPDNRLYQANLRRLRAQVAGRDRPPNTQRRLDEHKE